MKLNNKKDRLTSILREFETCSDTGEIYVCEHMVDFFAKGDKEVETKAYNLLKLMNETKKISEEAFTELLARDLDEDVWYII